METAKECLEKAGQEMTVWGDCIIQSELDGAFSPEASIAASVWHRCACGMLSCDIPRDEDDEPLDDQLSKLGLAFWRAVDVNEFYRAARCLIAIKAREKDILENLTGGK